MLTAVNENHRVPGEEVYLIYGGMSGKTLPAEREWMGRSQPGVCLSGPRGAKQLDLGTACAKPL